MVENNYIENKNNIENSEVVLKTNVYYQKIFNERLNSFKDNLRKPPTQWLYCISLILKIYIKIYLKL